MAALMEAVSSAKEIAELVKKYNDLPLYEKIVALQAQITDQANDLLRLNQETAELRQQVNLRTTISFQNPYFYEEGNEVPLCPKCYSGSGEKLRIYLTHPSADYPGGHGRICRHCKEFYREGPRKEPKPAFARPGVTSLARHYWE